MKYQEIIHESWVEAIALIFVLVSFFLSIAINSAFLNYLVIILAGFLAGRFFFTKRFKEPLFPYILIILGFLLGFILASFRANRFLILIFFSASAWASYQLHQKGYLEFFKTAGFIR